MVTVTGSTAGLRRVKLSVIVRVVVTGMAFAAVACTAPPKVPFTHLMHWNGEAVPGYVYSVKRGDTLASIAAHFEVDVNLIARMNKRRPDIALGAGDRIFIPRLRGGFAQSYYTKPRRGDPTPQRSNTDRRIPGATTGPAPGVGNSVRTASGSQNMIRPTPRVIAQATPSARATGGPGAMPGAGAARSRSFPSSSRPTASGGRDSKRGIEIAQSYTKRLFPRSSQARVSDHPRFQWPTQGTITSGYNAISSKARIHLGIDVGNKEGTPVRAAYGGTVIYSDSEYLPSMGNMVLIEHSGGWITLYAHNLRNLVKEGDRVERGQMIALMGQTGRATGPHLHFEIRKDAHTPVNPLDYLPTTR